MSDTIAEVTVPKQRPKKPETRTPRVAVIGCGYWGRNLVRNFANLGALAAICDHDYALASTLGEEHGAPVAAFSDITASADIDAVVIAAPAERHFIIAEEALIAGKHVFVEKPLALDIEQAEALCDLAEQNDRVLMVGHLLQYHPAFVRLKEIVLGGELGRIQYLYSNRLNLGKIRREENILWSFAPHDISMILALVGEEPDTVSATGAKFLHKYIADVTTTHLSFPSGPHAHVFVSWLHPVKEQRLVVVGDRQMAVFDDGQDWPAKLTLYPDRVNWRNGQPEPVKGDAIAVPLEKAEPLALECGHFLDCLREHKKPRTDGREGLRVLRVLQMAEHSMNSRCAQVSTVRPVEDFTPAPAPAPMPAPARAAERKRPEPAAKSAPEGVVIHESAYVDTPCSIGKGTKIWHFGHVLKGTRIGRDCVLGQNVMVGPDVTVGDNCKIQNNVSLYKGVVLEDDVFCGPSCVFTNVYNPRASVERKEEFRDTRVGRGATIGANATIVCGNAVGAYSLVAAGAVVTHDVPPHAIVAGVPARRIGWVSHDGEILGDDLKCPRSGRRYRLEDENTLVEMRDE